MTSAISCHDIRKIYPGGTTALVKLNLEIAPGQIYGLVGRNGAGKTTLMRILLGLVRPSAGSATILGQPVASRGSGGLIGSLVEQPAFVPHLSGRANLVQLAAFLGQPSSEADRVLNLVGLQERGASRFSQYSLGMKQRLGIAAAALGDPPVMILDEPINGLDPQTIVFIRELLQKLKNQGHTVLLSSHLLSELEQCVDRVAILHEGQLVAEGTLKEIQDSARSQSSTRIEVSDPGQAVRILDDVLSVTATIPDREHIEIAAATASTAEAVAALVAAGIEVRGMQQHSSLETAYLSMTSDPGRRTQHEVTRNP